IWSSGDYTVVARHLHPISVAAVDALGITRGEDVLDALIAGVNIVELDPADDSVGYGGLPNAEGVVQLDASCMHGPRRRAGAVASIEGVRTPSKVARAVMDLTDHHLLVGKGAQDFARQLGMTVEADLNTENSRKQWLEWKRRIDPDHWLDPQKRAEASKRVWREMLAEGLIDPDHAWGTINCDGITPKGELAGVTTTSGLSWKIPGRVGDSPILGAGLYVDGEFGAAGSTGRGEANLYNLSSYLIVEGLRRGLHPKDAGMEAVKRIKENTVEKRLLTEDGRPDFYVSFYILDRAGRFAGVDLYSTWRGRPRQFAVCTENGPQILPSESLLGEGPPAAS
ncbi:MAG TPA: N(4)-(beta-N-acetylglucosaminyl)-L-asparaginase, partial [Vicinamibacteria bacterium]|nr:N(4)-(beta-N-acetylglucosaminyl)-L-asparaginase [Vicinamibacteria bacterium]